VVASVSERVRETYGIEIASDQGEALLLAITVAMKNSHAEVVLGERTES
jgi:uncharacterized protein YxjI